MLRSLFLLLLFSSSLGYNLLAQSITNFEGDYVGTAYRILMNGEPKMPQNMVFTLKNGVLTAHLTKFGKMPGSLHFYIPAVSLDTDGKLTTSAPNAGKIKLFGLFSPTLEWDSDSGDPLGAFHGVLRLIHGVKTLELHLNVTTSVGPSRKKAMFSFLGAIK